MGRLSQTIFLKSKIRIERSYAPEAYKILFDPISSMRPVYMKVLILMILKIAKRVFSTNLKIHGKYTVPI